MDEVNLIDFLDEIDEYNHGYNILRPLYERKNPFVIYGDMKFRKDAVRALIDLLADDLKRSTNRHTSLSVETQVFFALRFLANGGFQREMGGLHGVSQNAVSKSMHRVIESIAKLKSIYIHFPQPDEFQQIQTESYNDHGFPGVVGAIDCTHVPIKNPGGNDSELFRNRKGWFSLNVQLMCDSKLRIRNVVASWKGSTHDARIFHESVLKDQLERIPPNLHIIGDHGYPCLRYLLTPIVNPQTDAEKRYNTAHSSTRMAIERLNDVLKRRFACLSHPLRYSPRKCEAIIVACAVLHNFGKIQKDEDENENVNENYVENEELEEHLEIPTGNNAQGLAKRRAIITYE